MDTNNDMYICLCNGVKQSQIDNAISDGIDTLENLQETLEVAINCGACTNEVLCILNNHKKKTNEANPES